MEHFWTLYWITRLDNLGFLFVLLSILSAIGVFVSVVNYTDNGEGLYKGEKELARKAWKRYGILSFTLVLLFSTAKALMPSKEDAYFIAAGVGITEAVKSETAQRLASKSVGVIEQWLDKQAKQEEKK